MVKFKAGFKNKPDFSMKGKVATNFKKAISSEGGEYLKEGTKQATKNFKEAFKDSNGGKGIAKSIISSSVSPAIGGAVIGAGVNTVRGENAWDGAKTGAVMGAGYGAGKTVIRGGMGISKAPKISTAQGAKDMSKSVKEVVNLNRNVNVAKNNMKYGKNSFRNAPRR